LPHATCARAWAADFPLPTLLSCPPPPPCAQIVGYEGVFGVIGTLGIMAPIAYYLPGAALLQRTRPAADASNIAVKQPCRCLAVVCLVAGVPHAGKSIAASTAPCTACVWRPFLFGSDVQGLLRAVHGPPACQPLLCQQPCALDSHSLLTSRCGGRGHPRRHQGHSSGACMLALF